VKIENPYFVIEPMKGPPFLVLRRSTADAIVRAKINDQECDIYLSVRDDWEITGVLSPKGVNVDKEELRKALITHPNLRLFYLVEG
jgi:hypothetical protein